MELVKVKNESLQSLEIFLKSDDGPKSVCMGPKSSIRVNRSRLTSQVHNLIRRKIIKLEA
jgi:hypothetical protein